MDGKDGRRVVVTGIGVVTPCGIGKEAFWTGLQQPVPQGDHLEVPDFDPEPWFDGPKEVRRADRVEQFARAAAGMALADGGEPTADPMRRGVMIATGIGGLYTLESQVLVRVEKGERRVSPFLVPMIMANAGAASVSMRYGWQGPCETVTTACAASTHALGNARPAHRLGPLRRRPRRRQREQHDGDGAGRVPQHDRPHARPASACPSTPGATAS